jgi:hypothetical protein
MAMHGDKKHTLSLACEVQIETEANYAAGRLLFLQDEFLTPVRSSPLELSAIKGLSKAFGNTMTSTLWRAVEVYEGASFGLVSQHPRHPLKEEPIRYFVRSRSFAAQFSNVGAMQLFRALQMFCFGARGPIGSCEVPLVDIAGGDITETCGR